MRHENQLAVYSAGIGERCGETTRKGPSVVPLTPLVVSLLPAPSCTPRSTRNALFSETLQLARLPVSMRTVTKTRTAAMLQATRQDRTQTRTRPSGLWTRGSQKVFARTSGGMHSGREVFKLACKTVRAADYATQVQTSDSELTLEAPSTEPVAFSSALSKALCRQPLSHLLRYRLATGS